MSKHPICLSVLFPVFVAVGDLDGDGADLTVVNRSNDASGGSNNVAVLSGRGDGTFRAALNFGADRDPVAVADLTGDGKSDLAVANFFSNSISVLTNNTPTARPVLGNLAATFIGLPLKLH